MTQWPDPNKPGYPADPDKCGAFWLLWSDGQTTSLLWDSVDEVWITVVAGKKKPQEVVNFIASSGKTATLINLADAFTAGARAAREQAFEWMIGFSARQRELCLKCGMNSGWEQYYHRQIAIDDAKHAIESLPLPNSHQLAKNSHQEVATISKSATPENAANTGENLSASVDLSGFEELAEIWLDRRWRGGDYDEGFANAQNSCGEDLRAEIAKLKGK